MVQGKQIKEGGFTIVELLIVIVVVAILAAITSVAFTGISDRAVESSIKSDLTQSAKKISVHRVNNGDQLPQSVNCPAEDPTEVCLSLSGDNRVEYYGVSSVDPTKYTLQITNGSKTFSVDGSGVPVDSSMVSSGLVSRFSSNNEASYSAGATIFRDLVGDKDAQLTNVTYAENRGNLELIFDGLHSAIRIPDLEVQSVFIMVNLDGLQATSRYFIDARPGNPAGYIYNNGVGNWTGFMVNGEPISNSLAAIPKDQWVGFYAETDDVYTTRLGIMSRVSNGERHAGKVGEVLVFNRKLSTEEVRQVFHFFKPRYEL